MHSPLGFERELDALKHDGEHAARPLLLVALGWEERDCNGLIPDPDVAPPLPPLSLSLSLSPSLSRPLIW